MLKRIKTAMTVLGAAALILSAAYLPHIAAAIHDGENRQARFAQINAVELDIQEKLTALGKLSLTRWLASGIEISEEDARMTMDEVRAAAYEGNDPYYASGLILPFEETYSTFSPLLIQDPQWPQRYMIVWEGVIIRTDPYRAVTCGIDDETGRILYLEFREIGVVSRQAEYETYLASFSEIFFQNLGITEYQTLVCEEITDGGELIGIRYRFEDAPYGSFAVEFTATGSGFKIGFSK